MSQISNTWIFQGRPETWDVSRGVNSLTDIHWVVRQYGSDIKTGDRVYIWESGDKAGIVATATVTSLPTLSEDDAAEVKLYPGGPPTEFKGKQLRVSLHIDRVVLPRLKKTELQKHPTLKSLNIIRNPRGTNFKVSAEQVGPLESLVSSH
jgi:hypothetical protein